MHLVYKFYETKMYQTMSFTTSVPHKTKEAFIMAVYGDISVVLLALCIYHTMQYKNNSSHFLANNS